MDEAHDKRDTLMQALQQLHDVHAEVAALQGELAQARGSLKAVHDALSARTASLLASETEVARLKDWIDVLKVNLLFVLASIYSICLYKTCSDCVGRNSSSTIPTRVL
jgi:hypothetical protein